MKPTVSPTNLKENPIVFSVQQVEDQPAVWIRKGFNWLNRLSTEVVDAFNWPLNKAVNFYISVAEDVDTVISRVKANITLDTEDRANRIWVIFIIKMTGDIN